MVDILVTVVIVNYNSGAMLARCIEHVLDSTLPARIIVSDNASTDDSLQLLEQAWNNHPAITLHKNHANLGFSAANNAVYNQINTPFILYLNPDCFIEKNTLEHFVFIMNEHAHAGMAGCLVTNMDGTEQIGCRGMTPTPGRILNQLLQLNKLFPDNPHYSGYLLSNHPLPEQPISVELISGSCMFVRKKAADEVGLLDQNYFLYCEDYDWFYRFTQSNWNILFTAGTKVSHIKSFSTKQIPLKVLLYKARGMWRYHNKFFKSKSNPLKTFFIRAGIVLRFFILSAKVILSKIWSLIPVFSK